MSDEESGSNNEMKEDVEEEDVDAAVSIVTSADEHPLALDAAIALPFSSSGAILSPIYSIMEFVLTCEVFLILAPLPAPALLAADSVVSDVLADSVANALVSEVCVT